jgi:NAD(P)-dependent dehydrogenase (short-subunit alcohol dehydrogenase family)
LDGVICADRAREGAEATAAGIRAQGGSAEVATCDAANSKDVAALAKTVMQKFPRLDIAVTTPGPNIRKTILDYTEEDLDRVINASEVNRWSSAGEVATAVAYLASDAASYVSGSTLFVDGSWTAVDGPPTGLTQLAK